MTSSEVSIIPIHSYAPACVLSNFGWVRLSVTLWTAARPGSTVTGFSRQKYLGGLPFPPPGDLPNTLNPYLLHCMQILYRGKPLYR